MACSSCRFAALFTCKYGANDVDDRYKCHKGSSYAIKKFHVNVMGSSRSSTVGTASGYALDDLQFESRQGKRYAHIIYYYYY